MSKRKKKVDREFLCLDCSADVAESGEYFMTRAEVWAEVNPSIDGMLCLNCLEQRLGRELNHDDFRWCPLNLNAIFHGSERLRERMGANGMLVHLADMPLGDLAFSISSAVIEEDERIEAIMKKSTETVQYLSE